MWWYYLLAVVIVSYLIYVYFYFRYSDVNIGNKILSKYTIGKNPPTALFYNYSDATIEPLHTKAQALISLRDKVTLNVKSSEVAKVKVSPTCKVYDNSCIFI
jgi:hypothetical protein